MSNEISNINNAIASPDSMLFYPDLVEEHVPLASYSKVSLNDLSSLGVAAEPIQSLAQAIFSQSGGSGIYKVTVPDGAHLAAFKSGKGFLGTALNNTTNVIDGQAVLNPVMCNPTMIFMAVALSNINQKLSSIQETQQEMIEYMKIQDQSSIRGDLTMLSDILKEFKDNWDQEWYKKKYITKVIDIKQDAEKKIQQYRALISSRLAKQSPIHSDRDARKRIDQIQSDFGEYQLALYILGFSSFLDVILTENYRESYINSVIGKIQDYAIKYRELYTSCYTQLEAYYNSSVGSFIKRGLTAASKITGETIAKIPVISKGPVDKALIGASEKMEEESSFKAYETMKKLIDRQGANVVPFIEMLGFFSKFYNNPINIVFDKDNVYFGTAEAA